MCISKSVLKKFPYVSVDLNCSRNVPIHGYGFSIIFPRNVYGFMTNQQFETPGPPGDPN